jgi:hypothetical protein
VKMIKVHVALLAVLAVLAPLAVSWQGAARMSEAGHLVSATAFWQLAAPRRRVQQGRQSVSSQPVLGSQTVSQLLTMLRIVTARARGGI